MLVWQISAMETIQSGYPFIEKEHLIIGLLKISDILDKDIRAKSKIEIPSTDIDVLAKEIIPLDNIFKKLNINKILLRRLIRKLNGKLSHDHQGDFVHRSEESRKCFKKAIEIAEKEQALSLRPKHLLAVLMEDPGKIITNALHQFKITPADIRNLCLLQENEITTIHKETQNGETDKDFLLRFGEDLNKSARDGIVTPLIGRDKEILQIIHTLGRKTKNNPLLIGDAGVGKTAIVRGLALKITYGDIIPPLRKKRIIELNMGALIAGTKYRGDFEDRVIKVLDECRQDENIILFIDEIHTLIGAGKTQGSVDIADIIKPALSKGEITCIGSTTNEEYRKYIEKDSALERRFQPIMINEPTELETIEILKGLKKLFEDHHKVTISPAIVEIAVKLSVRYIQDRNLPDKAIDVLDEACTRVNVSRLSNNEIIGENNLKAADISEDIVAKVVADWSGRPVEKLDVHDRTKLIYMEEELQKKIIGQNDAIAKLVRLVKIARTKLRDPKKPLGVLLFIGPTGVGKTELAKALAAFLFESKNALIRIDMSEYMEKHSVAKLIGSPPGYVGYEEEGQLTGKLRRHPHSVVLFDEIEKAHPEVLDLFLQLFDEGRITDNKGRTANARHSIFIMTSNIGSDFGKKSLPGFGRPIEEQYYDRLKIQLKKKLKMEFINRIDDIILFNALELQDVVKIAKISISQLEERLTDQKIKLVISDDAINHVARKGYDPVMGARPLARAIQDLITTPISEMIVNAKIKEGDSININLKNNSIILDIR